MTVLNNKELQAQVKKDKIRRELHLFNLNINSLYKQAKFIRKLHFIQNTILANCVYNEDEQDKQQEAIKNLITIEDTSIIEAIWKKRNELGIKLKSDLKELLK